MGVDVLDDDASFPTSQCPTMSYFVYSSTLGVPIVGAASSILFLYLFYLFFYIRAPILHRHPTSIAIYKCMLEFILAQQYMWVPFLEYFDLYRVNQDTTLDNSTGCKSNNITAFVAFISQFCAIGSELTLFVVTYALYVAHKNPFTS